MDLLTAYIPMDRRQALVQGRPLPERTEGAALFADISGFTPLTAALAQELGARRGAEELTRQLNHVYNALIAEVHEYRGSVINFTGDAITCWFDGDDGRRATACAFAIQHAMQQFTEVRTPAGTIVSLAVKVAVAVGPVRRFRVGEPAIQYMDALAGRTLALMAAGEQMAEKGEVVVSEQTAAQLGECAAVAEWRTNDETGHRFAALSHLTTDIPRTPWPALPDGAITAEQAREWILPPIIERLREGQAEYLAELRPATPLFLKFDGIEYDEDEQAGEKLDLFIQWVQNVLARYEAYVLQVTVGDKGSYLYTAFGAPLAHDDDPGRAVAAGLELSTPPPNLRFIHTIQIGISQGRVRAGAYGADASRTYGVLGEETNMAARLMGKAGLGQVYVREWVAEAVRSQYNVQDLGLMKVKGKEEPIRVFQVLGRLHASFQRPATLYSQPLIGRETELTMMEEILRQSFQTGQILNVQGATGVGKSHVTAELTNRALHEGVRIAVGSCQSISQSTAYTPWRQVLGVLLGLDETGESVQIGQIQRQIEAMNHEWLLRLPLLGDLLGVAIPENDTTRALDPKLRQEALFALVIDLLRKWTEEQPLLILVEDVHWLDEASQGLVLAIGRVLSSMPLLLLLTQRPALRADQAVLPALSEFEHYHALELTELAADALTQLVQNQVEGDVSPLALALIEAKSHGNPFFTEELVDALQESGALVQAPDGVWTLSQEIIQALREGDCLVQQGDGWALAADAPLTGVNIGVPDSIYGTVLSRLDRLPEGHKLTLKVASVIGRTFEVRLVHSSHPAHVEAEILRVQTQELDARDFIRLERPSLIPGEMTAVYFFRHNTTQEVAYDTLLFMQRKQLHQAIGQELERLNPEQVTAVAHHAYAGEDWPRALKYQALAGKRAQQLFANTEAIEHFRKALHCTTYLPEEETAEARLDINSATGELLVTTGQYDKANEHLQEALKLAQAAQDFNAQARVCRWIGRSYELRGEYMPALEWLQNGLYILEDEALETAELAELHVIAGLINTRQGNYEKALERAQRSLSFAQKQGAKDVLARAYNLMGHISRLQGNSTAAIDYFEIGLELCQATNNIHAQALAHNQIANAYFNMGQWVQARQSYQKARDTFSQVGDIYHRSVTDNNLAGISLNQGRLDEALRYYQSGLNGLRQIGGSLWVLGVLHNNLGATYARRNETEMALEHLNISRDYFAQANARDFLPELYRHFAEVALLTAEYDHAHRNGEEALTLARELNMRGEEGNSLRVLGEIALRQGNFTAAQDYLAQSSLILDETGEEYEWARAQLLLAELAIARAERAQAAEFLAACQPIFERLDAQLDLGRVKALQFLDVQ